MNNASTYTEQLFVPNPMYNKLDAICNDDIALLMDEIRRFACEFDDEEEAVLAMHQKYGERIYALFDTFEETPETPTTMPSPPAPSEVYCRVSSDSVVVDVGSGDGTRASRCQARSVCMTDIVPAGGNPDDPCVIRECRGEDILEVVEELGGVEEVVLTSFNSLTQVSDLSSIEKVTGVHIVPDVEFLREHMGSEESGNLLTTISNGKVFKDYDHRLIGDKIKDGYLGYNTFRSSRGRYVRKGRIKVSAFTCPIADLDYVPNHVSTPKYDGICMKFTSLSKGGATLALRNGDAYEYLVEGNVGDVELILEKLPKKGPPRAFVLLRVVHYNGVVPFHGLECLRKFLANVKFEITEKGSAIPIYYPGHPELSVYDTDGLIYRIGGRDYRYKAVHTFDVSNILSRLERISENYGYDLVLQVPEYILEDKTSIREYVLEPGEMRVVVKHVGKRVDKVSETSNDRIVEMIESIVWQ